MRARTLDGAHRGEHAASNADFINVASSTSTA